MRRSNRPKRWLKRRPSMLRKLINKLRSAQETSMLKVGDQAPDFDLLDHQGQALRLADLAGKRFVLWFYPKADTPG